MSEKMNTEDAKDTAARPVNIKAVAMAKFQSEYAHMCAALGEAQYQIGIYQERVKDLTTKMRKINVKASKLVGKVPVEPDMEKTEE